MSRNVFALVGLLMSLLLAGCGPDAPASHSRYGLGTYFRDPRAQALALAAEQGDAAQVRHLMKDEHIDPDRYFSVDGSGMPLIGWPIYTHNPAGLKALLDNGADPNARKPGTHSKHYADGSGGTYFDYNNAMVLAATEKDPIYLKLLLDHGGDPNTRNANDEPLLFQAFIWHNQWQNVQLLVERGADVNDTSRGTSILLDYTSRGGFRQAYWLLQHGADPEAVGDLLKQPPPPAPKCNLIVEDVFWHPGNPDDPTWQRKCQQWFLAHGYKRPPIPKDYRDMRKNLGFPYEEKDIPLL
nr:ankyrin repeat domain-containing protein [Dyella ginsengisoli]